MNVAEALDQSRDLLCGEFASTLRRLGETEDGSTPAPDEDADIRGQIDAALVELGLAQPLPPDDRLTLAAQLGESLHLSTVMHAQWLHLLASDPDSPLRPLREQAAAGELRVGIGLVTVEDRQDGADAHGADAHGAVQWRAVPDADHIDRLVLLRGGTAHVVNPGRGSVSLHPELTLSSRRLFRVDLATDQADLVCTLSPDTWAAGLAAIRLTHASYLLGAGRAALGQTTHRLRDRSAFGKPLSKQQALTHRVAALDARHRAAQALATQITAEPTTPHAHLRALQTLTLAIRLLTDITSAAIHLHGAFGMTLTSDAQLFHRRGLVDAQLLGTVHDFNRQARTLLTAKDEQ